MELTKESKLYHPDFGDVYKTTYKEGEIISFDVLEPKSVFTLADTCTVKIGEDTFEKVPFLYRCKKDCYDEKVGIPREDNPLTLYGAARAFAIGDKVCTLLYANEPKYVIGHMDAKPQMCIDLIRIKHFRLTVPGWPDGGYNLLLSMNGQKVFGYFAPGAELKDKYGFSLKCDNKAECIYDKRWFEQRGWKYPTIFRCDRAIWYIPIPPIAYAIEIFQSVRLDLAYIDEMYIWMWAALWDKDQRDRWKAWDYTGHHYQGDFSIQLLNLSWEKKILWNSVDIKIYTQSRDLWQ